MLSDRILLSLCVLGLLDSLYLTWAYLTGGPIACNGTGCDVVRLSQYSRLLGAPTPVWGVTAYGLLAILELMHSGTAFTRRAALSKIAAGLALAFLFVSLYLAWVSLVVLHAACLWCALSLALIMIITPLTLIKASKDGHHQPTRTTRSGLMVVVLLVAIVAAWSAAWHKPSRTFIIAELPASLVDQRLLRATSHLHGQPSAPVTVVEFADLSCPACARANVLVHQLSNKYGKRVRFVFRQYPLLRKHKASRELAIACECAADQSKFNEAIDFVFRRLGEPPGAIRKAMIAHLRLDSTAFERCTVEPQALSRISADLQDAAALGVTSTPTFFIGNKRIEGLPTYSEFSQLLDIELARERKQRLVWR